MAIMRRSATSHFKPFEINRFACNTHTNQPDLRAGRGRS
jgi:hypothetical protein